MTAHDHAPCWHFESTVHTPSGVQITTTIAIPETRAWDDVPEVAEIAQSATGRALALIRTASRWDRA